jgi:hypothetical protein
LLEEYMTRKRHILPPVHHLDTNQLLKDAETLIQAHQAQREREQQRWLQPTFRYRWDTAVAHLTRDPSLDLGRTATVAEACATWAKAWHEFGSLLHQAGLCAAALQIQRDADDARSAAVELFHYAARRASAQEFEKALLFLGTRFDLWNFKDHVPDLAKQSWSAAHPPAQLMTREPIPLSTPPEDIPSRKPSSRVETQRRWVEQVQTLILTHPDQTAE